MKAEASGDRDDDAVGLRERLGRRTEEIEGLLEASGGLIFRARTSDLALLYAAPNTEDVTGIPSDTWTENPHFWTTRVPDEDIERITQRVREARDSGQDRLQLDLRLRHADDQLHWYRAVLQFERDEDGEHVSFVGTAVDVTEERRHQRQLRRETERYRALFEDAAEAIIVSDYEGRIREVNDAFMELSGYSRSELNDAQAHDFYIDSSQREELFRRLAEEGRVQDFEVRLRRADGAVRLCLITASKIGGASEERLIQSVLRDITEERQREEALRHQALHDPLTGLPNRTLFWDRLEQTIARVERRGDMGALLYVDLNGFKTINDRLGHQTGDEVLVEVAKRLVEAVRDVDTVARIGGDEFALLLPHLTGPQDAREIADRALGNLTSPIRADSAEVEVSAAIGIALLADSDRQDAVQTATLRENPDVLLERGDAAMYRAKEKEGSTVAMYRPSMDAEA